jgi:hypothetical protein
VTTGGVASNVNVQNSPTVNINTMPNVTIGSIPSIVSGDGGITTIGAKADAVVTNPATAGSLVALTKGVIKQLQGGGTGAAPISNANLDATISSLVAAVNALKTASPLAATAGISVSSQVSVGVTATVLFNGVVTGHSLAIQNFDSSGMLFLGPDTVTALTGGIRIPPGGSYSLDVVSGSTISIYGVGSIALTAGISVVV